MFDASCNRILVRGVNWIGDSVMTFPAHRSLRKAFPEAHIELVVKPWVSDLFVGNPYVNGIRIYGNESNGFLGKFRFSRGLAKGAFCGAIFFQNAFDAAVLAFLAGIKYRAGYQRDGRGFLLTDPVQVPSDTYKTHQIFYYLNLLRCLGIRAEYSVPYIFLSFDERRHALKQVEQMRRPILGINPGATFGSAKQWFPEKFAEVANWFLKDTHGSVVIFGGSPETGIADRIYMLIDHSFRAGKAVLNIAGKTALRELIQLISESDVFVSNDSGPMHLAYALRVPLVALFGSTDPQLTGPPPGIIGQSTEVIKSDIACSPCFERTCRKNDMKCMYEVLSDDVFYAVQKVLPRKSAVFLDRDGTLCEDTNYLNSFEKLHVFSEIESLKRLDNRGFLIIGVSNQAGIGRGIVQREFVEQVNEMFISTYGFDDFFYCPHHPEERCRCRKPEPEMLLRARLKHGIDLRRSYVVGDKDSDMMLAKAVGAQGVLVQTGKQKESQHADFVAKNLKEAVSYILDRPSPD